jgi:2',3'-cyclic-nucleotide 2'-phosphodiesterase (5'-nucleotidase family)
VYTILHTNDFHNHLTPAQAQRLGLIRAALGGNGLLLDAGDAISAGNVTFHRHEPILDAMRAAGYDAMTVGNREFHFSALGFQCKIGDAGFPVLCANLRPASPTSVAGSGASDQSGESLPTRRWAEMKAFDGRKIVVVGLTVPMITARMLVRRVSAYVFDDPIETARILVPRLRAQLRPDLLVALTHIGIAQDRRLAQEVPEIDLIIGGHTHVTLDQGERVGSTLIAQAGSHGRLIGRVEVNFESMTTGRPGLSASLETL